MDAILSLANSTQSMNELRGTVITHGLSKLPSLVINSPSLLNGLLAQYPNERSVKREDNYFSAFNEAVREYLRHSPETLDTFKQSMFLLRKHFGTDVEFTVDVVDDPEIPNDVDFVVQISTTGGVKSALKTLSAFRGEWIRKFTSAEQGRIVFSLR